MQPVTTAAYTTLFGIFVFVVGQFVQRFWLEPIQELRKLIGEIAESLLYYANKRESGIEGHYVERLKEIEQIEDTGAKVLQERYKELIKKSFADSEESQNVLRKQAGQLLGRANVIMGYNFWAFLGVVPKYVDLARASEELVGLSNSSKGFDSKRTTEISTRLRIRR